MPDGFERDPEADSVVFKHAEIDGRVTVSVLRHAGDSPKKDLFESLPGREGMQNVREAESNGATVQYGDYTGELMNEPEAWRWWVIQRGPIAVVVSFNGDVESAKLSKELVNGFVDGIHVVDVPPLGVEEFTSLAANVYARVLDKPVPPIVRPLELNTGEKSLLRLENAYISYLDAHMENPQSDASEMLSVWLESMWSVDKEDLSDWKHARAIIYPVLKPWGFARETDIPVVKRTLVDKALIQLVAVDTGRTLRFLSKDDLDKWDGVSEEDVFFYARENLAAMNPEFNCQVLPNDEGKPMAIIFASGDSYDASRLLLPGLFEKLSEHLGTSMLVGVPNRDFMIVVSERDPELVAKISAQVKVDSETQPYSISGTMFRLTADGVSAS
ncbi:MAG: DUF1444 family protein [Planctomycetota bacterium]